MNDWKAMNSGEDVTLPRSFRVTLRRRSGELVSEIVTIEAEAVRAHAAAGPLSNRLLSHALSAALSAHADAELVGSIERVHHSEGGRS
jgi:hypothetical protein